MDFSQKLSHGVRQANYLIDRKFYIWGLPKKN